MLDTRFLRASDGTGPAPIARINTARIAGATVFKVDTVNKWPPQAFIATVGTLNVNGYLDPTLAPINEFRGHITGSDIILDSWEPGNSFATTDLGNAVNQYIILKQTTGTANLIQDAIAELQNEDILRASRTTNDFVVSGGVWSLVSGLNGAMTALIANQAGLPVSVALIASRAFTVSKDTYVDVLRGGTNIAPTGTIVYTEVANGATSPALAANSIRLAVVVTNGAGITGVFQQADMLRSWGGFDTLANPVLPQYNSRVVGRFTSIVSTTTGASASAVPWNGLNLSPSGIPFRGIAGKTYRLTMHEPILDGYTGTSGFAQFPIHLAATGATWTNQVGFMRTPIGSGGVGADSTCEFTCTTTGLQYINMQFSTVGASGTFGIERQITYPANYTIELVN